MAWRTRQFSHYSGKTSTNLRLKEKFTWIKPAWSSHKLLRNENTGGKKKVKGSEFWTVQEWPGGMLLMIQISHCKHFSSCASPSSLECIWVLFSNTNTPFFALFNLTSKCQPSWRTAIPSVKWLWISWLALMSKAAGICLSCWLHAKLSLLPLPCSTQTCNPQISHPPHFPLLVCSLLPI